ncbi:MAG: hypothetical protein J6386_01795 [Candidatus Synoicihabitans palmerolidicus]|nr:hypothetical protein [Candidatus Synoicihabitans palmerolidicus]
MTRAIRSGRNWKQSLDTLQRYTPYTFIHAAFRSVRVDKDIMNDAAHDGMQAVNAYALE